MNRILAGQLRHALCIESEEEFRVLLAKTRNWMSDTGASKELVSFMSELTKFLIQVDGRSESCARNIDASAYSVALSFLDLGTFNVDDLKPDGKD